MPTLYDPNTGARWRPRPPIDEARCRAQTYESVSRNFSQCARKAVVFENNIGYCRQHSPAAERARNEERRKRESAEAERRERQWKRPQDYRDTLREIANGHNDPRSVARGILAKWGDLEA